MNEEPAKTRQKDEEEERGEVKSALEIGLEKAEQMKEEPIEIQTEEGSVSMTFDEIKEKAVKADEYLKDLQYKQAEFENYRKRTLREKENLLKESVPVGDLFEILDTLDHALESDGDEASIKEGVQLIRNKLWALLEKKEVERIPSVGEPFDPNLHEAVAEQADTEVPNGHVVVEYRSGFKIGEKVLRPAQVVVSSGPPEESGDGNGG